MSLNLCNKVRSLIHTHGTVGMKRYLWNRDYLSGRYGHGSTKNDFLYPIVSAYLQGGSLLDLGCGEGKTANELTPDAYNTILGVDISQEAVARAIEWSTRIGRADKNHFVSNDIDKFYPPHDFNIILFRDALYYVPNVAATLERYAQFLKDGGHFICRFCEGTTRHAPLIQRIESMFTVSEKRYSGAAAVIVFHPFG